MTIADPIADMLTRIRNAVMVKQDLVLMPSSKIKLAILKILKREGFIKDYEIVRDESHGVIKINLKYSDNKESIISGLERISKLGLRVYVKRKEIPRVYGGLGIAILSTSKGVMTGQQAWRREVGGELLCYIW